MTFRPLDQLDRDAVAFTLTRPGRDRDTTFTEIRFGGGNPAAAHCLGQFRDMGHLRSLDTTPDAYGILHALNTHGLVVQEFAVPDWSSFEHIRHTLGLTAVTGN